jgi:hypothetical protein
MSESKSGIIRLEDVLFQGKRPLRKEAGHTERSAENNIKPEHVLPGIYRLSVEYPSAVWRNQYNDSSPKEIIAKSSNLQPITLELLHDERQQKKDQTTLTEQDLWKKTRASIAAVGLHNFGLWIPGEATRVTFTLKHETTGKEYKNDCYIDKNGSLGKNALELDREKKSKIPQRIVDSELRASAAGQYDVKANFFRTDQLQGIELVEDVPIGTLESDGTVTFRQLTKEAVQLIGDGRLKKYGFDTDARWWQDNMQRVSFSITLRGGDRDNRTSSACVLDKNGLLVQADS